MNDGVPAGTDLRVHTLVIADKGTQASSPQRIRYQAVSNDCVSITWYLWRTSIRVGLKPGSDCMGLNIRRQLPSSVGSQYVEVLNREDSFMSGGRDLFDAPGRYAFYSQLGTYTETPFG